MANNRDGARAVRIIEQIGLIAEREGMARITGQIWGLLLTSDEPLSGAAISDKLQVSRGSVSTNTRLLESLGVLERRTIQGDRQIYYAMREHPYSNLARLSAERAGANCLQIRGLRDKETNSATRGRLDNLMHFYASTAQALQKCADELAALAKPENHA